MLQNPLRAVRGALYHAETGFVKRGGKWYNSPMIINLDKLLARVEKPARYTGGELNMVKKSPESVSLRFALAFPDIYEVGMSHLGSRILCDILNKREDTYCERVYMPWRDMREEMIKEGVPLFSLETKTPIGAFDIVGFSLTQEMCYTSVLAMLELSGIELWARRRETGPFILAGGPCTSNLEPVADFFDLAVLGDGEDVVSELADAFLKWKASGEGRAAFLREAGKIEGVYVPGFYTPRYEAGAFAGMDKESFAPAKVRKRAIASLKGAPFPDKPLVPGLSIIHDRAVLELFRGCTRGCRFCQAGMIYRPVRERGREELFEQAKEQIAATGCDEISLTSLSSGDYSDLEPLLVDMLREFTPNRVSVALPSLRADSFAKEVARSMGAVRVSSVTLAPEAGTQRLRDVINKGVTEEDILASARDAFESGIASLKLYFMLGLPTETDEDVLGIVELTRKISREYYSLPPEKRKKGLRITVSASNFVPKPHTPFQWCKQASVEELARKAVMLRRALKDVRGAQFQSHDARVSALEAVFALGDRRLAPVIIEAVKRGCALDAWTECFELSRWQEAFDAANMPMAPLSYAPGAPLPWGHLDYWITEDFLRAEYESALNEATTPDCRGGCLGCMGEAVCV